MNIVHFGGKFNQIPLPFLLLELHLPHQPLLGLEIHRDALQVVQSVHGLRHLKLARSRFLASSLLLSEGPLVDLVRTLELTYCTLRLIPVLVVRGRGNRLLQTLVHGASVHPMVLFGLVDFKEEAL